MPYLTLCNLGCSKNQIDGSTMAGYFRSQGYTLTENAPRAEIILVNTCAFIQEAKQEAIAAILELAAYKKTGACRALIVCGCFSQRFRDTVKGQFPEVDLWAGIDDWQTLFEKRFGLSGAPPFRRELEKPRSTQFLKIAEGCSHACTFCAIPGIRGKYRSRGIPELIEEATWLYEMGARECILVAQDTSYYGRDQSERLSHLLSELMGRTSFPWIRLMYLHPALVDEGLLRLIASEPRICPYFDIPLQHGADEILKLMARRPMSGAVRRLIGDIRSIVPGAAIRTTFIVGFPGETERMFEKLLLFVEEMKFDKVGVFPFSPEEGTPAFSMRPRPRNTTAARRCEALMAVQREISEKMGASRIGSVLDCIIDGPCESGGFDCEGRTRFDAPDVDGKVFIQGRPGLAGPIVPVRIVRADDYDLFGEIAV
jgi:ribosomal protein S12 methylthiotransferase